MRDLDFWRSGFPQFYRHRYHSKYSWRRLVRLNIRDGSFCLTVMIARSIRYYVEGTLAVFYGRRVLIFLKDNGVVIISVVASLALTRVNNLLAD